MDRLITDVLIHFQPVLVLIAIILSVVSLITNKNSSEPVAQRCMFYFMLFPVVVFSVWQCVSLLFFPTVTAMMNQAAVSPYESQLAMFYLAVVIVAVMAMVSRPALQVAVVAMVCCISWGSLVVGVIGSAGMVGPINALQAITSLLLPVILIVLHKMAQQPVEVAVQQ